MAIAARTTIIEAATIICALLLIGGELQSNDLRGRRGPAAVDVRILTELNGWSPSAPGMLASSFREESSRSSGLCPDDLSRDRCSIVA
jgi:hypothetical protein